MAVGAAGVSNLPALAFRAPPVRRAGPSAALVASRNQIEALKKRATALRANAQGKGGNVEAAVLTLVGGAASGAIKAKMPEIMGVDTRVPVSVVLIATGMFVVKGRMGGWLVNAGAGMAACVVSDQVEDMMDGDGDGGDDE